MTQELRSPERELLERVLHTSLNLSQAIRFQLELVAEEQTSELPVGVESARRTAGRLVEWLEGVAESYAATLDDEQGSDREE